MTTEPLSHVELPTRVSDRILRLESRNIEKLNAYLFALPDDFPPEMAHHLTVVGESLVEAVTASSRATAVAKLHPSPEAFAAESAAAKEVDYWRDIQRRHRASLEKQFAEFRESPETAPPFRLPRTNKSARSGTDRNTAPKVDMFDTSVTVPVVIDGVAPGTVISERQMQAHLDRAQKRFDAADERLTRRMEKATAPLNVAQTANLLQTLDERVAAAAKVRNSGEPGAEAAYQRAYRYRAQVRTAEKKCKDKSSFQVPAWRNVAAPEVLAEIETLFQDKTKARQQLDNLRARFRREHRETGTYTQPRPGSYVHTPTTIRKPAPVAKPKTGKGRRSAAEIREVLAKGPQGRFAQTVADKAWAPILMWPAPPADIYTGKRLMDRSNPRPTVSPSYVDGDTFHVLQPGLPTHQRLDVIFAHDIPYGTRRLITKTARVATRAAGFTGKGAHQQNFDSTYFPQELLGLPECLRHHVVPVPGSKRWVVSSRHLARVLDAFAGKNYPYRVIEFDAPPFFTDPAVSHVGRNKKPLPAVQFVGPTTPGPLTASGNHSLAGMCEFHLEDALAAGLAVVRYQPTDERMIKHREVEVPRHIENTEKMFSHTTPVRGRPIPVPKERPVLAPDVAILEVQPPLPPAHYLPTHPHTDEDSA